MAAPHESIVLDYARDTVDSPDACLDTQAAARRYLADLRNPMWNFRTGMAETIIEIIESLFCHQQGEDLLGRPLRGKPLILEPFQLFVIYNVCGFFYPGTDLRRFQEVLAMLARKNGKTPFATSFCWAVGLWYARSFSKIKTVSGSMKQNMEGFGFLRYNLRRLGLTMDIDPAHGLRMLDSSLGHSFEGPIWDGQISFEALAYKPDVFDAFNANVVLLDELELYKNAIPYGRLKDATKAYGNKLIIPEFTYTGDYEIVNDSDEPITVSQDDWKIRFLTSGTLTFTNLNGAEGGIDVFLVGGGGSGAGGGSNSDAGGYVQGAGAGGGYTKTTKNVAVDVDTEYTITIGSGGIGHAAYRTDGKSGGTTSAFGQSALGGSGGNANCHGGNGGSGGGAAGFGSNDRGAAGGMDGSNGGSVDSTPGGKGQGTTTREFGEENGKLYASGGNGYESPPTARDANSGNGGHGNGYGENKDGAGGSGIAIIRNARGAA